MPKHPKFTRQQRKETNKGDIDGTGTVLYWAEDKPIVNLNRMAVHVRYDSYAERNAFELQYREPANGRWETVDSYHTFNEARSEASDYVDEVGMNLKQRQADSN